MGLTRKYVPLLACAAFAVAGVPALAAGSGKATPAAAPALVDGGIVAFDFGFRDGSQASPDDNTVNITPGGKVTFSYPTGDSVHNVVFVDSGPQPTSCTQTVAPPPYPILPTPPLPFTSEPPGWSGSCTFNTAGTYNFFCSAHDYMTGTVIVGNVATPTPSPTSTPTA